jgi:hypothetical protein
MLGHCFYSVQDQKTCKFYNKQTNQFDINEASDPPLLTLEEAQEISKQSSYFKICLHENT